jgi:hypothetical protein
LQSRFAVIHADNADISSSFTTVSVQTDKLAASQSIVSSQSNGVWDSALKRAAVDQIRATDFGDSASQIRAETRQEGDQSS